MVATIRDIDVKEKRVLIRVDYNVPMAEDGSIADDTRIEASIPTLKALFQQGAKQLILMTHIGRPDGKVVEELRTIKVAARLAELMEKPVQQVKECINITLPTAEEAPLVMLENLRFHNEEEANDAIFSEKLAKNGDIYVNDAFGTAHRAHASTAGVASYLEGAIGLLIEKELHYLNVENMQAPIIAILGGAKLETKLPLIQKILPRVDKILLGGAMIFTFYKAKGLQIGTSLCDEESLTMAKMLLENKKIILPTDVVIANNPDDGSNAKVVPVEGIPATSMGLDIGPDSIKAFKNELVNAKTIVWNGPLGFVEKKPFEKATIEIAEYLTTLTPRGINTIVGGGDSINIVDKLSITEDFTHVSTGGGASMKLLEGKTLPAIAALEK